MAGVHQEAREKGKSVAKHVWSDFIGSIRVSHLAKGKAEELLTRHGRRPGISL